MGRSPVSEKTYVRAEDLLVGDFLAAMGTVIRAEKTGSGVVYVLFKIINSNRHDDLTFKVGEWVQIEERP
jgi:hypothetical protein